MQFVLLNIELNPKLLIRLNQRVLDSEHFNYYFFLLKLFTVGAIYCKEVNQTTYIRFFIIKKIFSLQPGCFLDFVKSSHKCFLIVSYVST